MITACGHSVQWQCAVQLLADMEEATVLVGSWTGFTIADTSREIHDVG